MTDLERIRAILDAATPGEWHWHTYGHATVRQAAGRITRALFRNPFHSTDLTWVHTEDEDGPNIALTGNGAKSWDNARAIVVSRNLAPELLAVAEAAEDALGDGVGAHGTVVRAALDALDAKIKETLP